MASRQIIEEFWVRFDKRKIRKLLTDNVLIRKDYKIKRYDVLKFGPSENCSEDIQIAWLTWGSRSYRDIESQDSLHNKEENPCIAPRMYKASNKFVNFKYLKINSLSR